MRKPNCALWEIEFVRRRNFSHYGELLFAIRNSFSKSLIFME